MAETAHLIPEIPPGEDELPCCDGEPMETERHRRQMALLIDSLEHALRDRSDVYIGGNMFVYYSELQTKRNDFRGPDFFVVFDTERRVRKSWVVWKEDGRSPDVVIELTSETTEDVDRGEKMRIYARALRVGEYYIYDPLSHRLDGYRLDPATTTYVPIEPLDGGLLPCGQLGLHLGLRPEPYRQVEGPWLRWIRPDGSVEPTAEEAERERAETERERAETERERAETERERAEAERDRAESIAAKLAAYEAKFGPLT